MKFEIIIYSFIFSHLKELKESNKWYFSYVFLPVSEEEPSCDACVQQLRVLLGQRDQVKTFLSTVTATEERTICLVHPRRPWKKKALMLHKKAEHVSSDRIHSFILIINEIYLLG